jgi:hypothetical protein
MLQYTGFTTMRGARQYSFSLHALDVPARFFTVVIDAAAFAPGLLKYQEGPEICYRKLWAALAAEEQDRPVCSGHRVTQSEIVAYKAAGRSRARTWTEEQRLDAKQRLKPIRLGHLMR